MGFRVHEGFEFKDGPSGDVLPSTTMLTIIGLICRRVIGHIQCGPPRTTFGPRDALKRSKALPWDFNVLDEDTAAGNTFALRAGFILHLAACYGILASAEQFGGSAMY